MRTYTIPEENIHRLQERMEALRKRARKLGCPEPTFEIGRAREVRRVEQDLDGERYEFVATVYDVTVGGEAPSYDGWTFAAVRDHEEGGAPIIRKCGDIEIPERFRAKGSACEHCRTKRYRKETFVLHHVDGRWIQVGRSCIRDFLGHLSPEHIAACAELIAEVQGGGFDDLSGEGSAHYEPTVEVYLRFVACVIRHHGWVSRKRAADDEFSGFGQTSTANVAMFWLSDRIAAAKTREPCKFPQPSEEDRARATDATEWARNIGSDGRPLSDYEHNVKVAAVRIAITDKTLGIIASIIPAWDRECARKREHGTSKHIGTVKVRMRDIRVTVDRVVPIDGAYGTSYINIMRDDDGNVVVWKASGKCLDTGGVYRLTGTVKKHSDFRGCAQTELTRCTAERVQFDGAEIEGLETAA